MLVILPTNQLDAMRAWNGPLGILANLPGVGSLFAKVINTIMLRRVGLLAWPNIWAGKQIVPELVGELYPATVAPVVLDYLAQPERLADMRSTLRSVRGEAGAAEKLVQIALELIQGL
jgi:lipid-A-disaccharide synthase